jgi:hypothetical protein
MKEDTASQQTRIARWLDGDPTVQNVMGRPY